jgi:hypothetical protein
MCFPNRKSSTGVGFVLYIEFGHILCVAESKESQG